ncbi:15318_t:CDS:2, partial [Entrophospora sp. SA101]
MTDTPKIQNGGRRFEFARNAIFWKWYSEYYPIKLIKTIDLDPEKNYLFGYHPHGVISVGAWTNFATEANNFSKEFPGIKCRLLTLASNFNIPLYRDYLMAQGLASVSRQSCENILCRKGPGHSIMIVVGGAGESLNARPGIYDLVLKKRLGFIKLSIRSGACLVPVFSFGENDIWEQADNPKESKVWKFQKLIQKYIGWTMPLFHGRGNDNPSEEEILKVQEKYIEGLYNIWNEYKDIYATNRKNYEDERDGNVKKQRSALIKNLIFEHYSDAKKTLSWSEEIYIADISIARKAYGVTFNDVMVATISRSIRSYFLELNHSLEPELLVYIPVSMRNLTDFDCNNKSSGCVSFIPFEEELSTKSLMNKVKSETTRMKKNFLCSLIYYLIEYILIAGMIPKKIFNDSAKSYHSIVTNVPGPMKPIIFTGQKVERFIAVPPQPGPGGLGIGILSYDGKVSISILSNEMPKYPNISK